MEIRWRLRMAAAQREVWTGAQLRRLLAERAGLQMSSASVSALFSKQPAQVKLETLAALCTALECSPNELFEVGQNRRPPEAGQCRRRESIPHLPRLLSARQTAPPGPLSCLPPSGRAGSPQAAMHRLRREPTPDGAGDLRKLHPPRAPPPPTEADGLCALR